jgi:hypothetical protein
MSFPKTKIDFLDEETTDFTVDFLVLSWYKLSSPGSVVRAFIYFFASKEESSIFSD